MGSRRGPALLLSILGALAAPAAADWQEAFAEGIKARDMKQWSKATRLMRQALAENPDETGERVRVYGMKWERYLPSYHLGIALYELDECAEALEAFERTRAQGAVGPAGRVLMTSREEECRERLAAAGAAPARSPRSPAPAGSSRTSAGGSPAPDPPSPPTRAAPPSPVPAPSAPPRTTLEVRRTALAEAIAEAEESLARAGEAARRLDDHIERTRRAVFRQHPALEERYQAAYRRLNGARFSLQGARRENDLQAVMRAGAEAETALTELEAVAEAAGVQAR